MLSIPSQPDTMAATSRPARAPEREASLQLRRVQADAYLDLTRIQREIERRAAALLEAHGLRDVTPAQASALMVLFAGREPLRARTLAARLGLSEVTVGRFVHAL